MARTGIGLQVRLTGKEVVKKEIDEILAYAKQNEIINLKFDTKGMTQSLSDFSKALDGISSKMNGAFKGEGAKKTTAEIKNATKANKEFEKSLGIAGIEKGYKQLQTRARELQNTMQSLSKVDVTRNAKGGVDKAVLSYTDQLGNTIKETMAWQNKTNSAGEVVSRVFKTIGTQATDNIAKVQQMNTKLEATRTAMQGKLNNATQLNSLNNNSFIDPNVLANVQAKLNAITTTTPKKEIKELQTVINNLGSGNSGIVKVQSKITSMVDGLAKMKAKYGDLVGDSHSLAQLQKYEAEIEKLKTLLASLKSGTAYSPTAISNATTNATNSSRNLTTAIQTSSRAMRTGGQDAISFGANMKKAFANAGFYMSTYMVIQKVFREIKQGIQTVIDMDSAMADLNKVVSMSKTQLDEMKQSAVAMGEAYAKSSIEVANAQAEAGRLYKDSATINKIAEASLIGSNVMDNTTSAEVAKSMATIMTAMKMDVSGTMVMLDSMNEVQNNYKISADSMIGALNEVASTAYTSGVSLQKAEGYITAIGVATGKESSEVGNSVRSLLAKIYKPKAQDMLEKEAKVNVKDEMGEYKKAGDVLDELNTKWATLSYTQQVNLAQSVGGIQRYNDFMSLMNNYQMSLDATATAENSSGSAMKENAIYMETAEAKLQQLKTTMQEFALNTLNSDTVKGGIDGLKELVETFGNLPSIIGLATTALLIFKGKALLGLITAMIDVEITMGATSTATALFSGVVNGASASIKSLGVAIASNPLGLLAVAITSIVVLVGSMDSQVEKFEKTMNELKKTSETLSEVKDNTKLVSQYEELDNKIKSNTLSTEELTKSRTDLLDMQKQLATLFPSLITG